MIDLLEIVGYIGAGALTLCSVPQLFKTHRTKDVSSLDFLFLLLWGLGLILMFVYVLFTTMQMPLLINYGFNTFIVGGLIYYYLKYK